MIIHPSLALQACGSFLIVAALATLPAVATGQGQGPGPPEGGDQALGLADLPAERAALSGKATIDGPGAADPPRPVSFRDLWDHPEDWRGRRVIVRGTVARVFRQGAVGSFPPLVEAWLSTPRGDLLCVVFPEPGSGPGDRPGHSRGVASAPPQPPGPRPPGERGEARRVAGTDRREAPGTGPGDQPLEAGREVAFTGTFLRTIRYAAADQPRLAPLIVGDRPPAPVEKTPGEGSAEAALRSIGASPVPVPDSRPSPVADSWPAAGWIFGLILGLAAAAVLGWQHLRGPSGVEYPSTRVAGVGPAGRRPGGGDVDDAPPEFLDIDTEPADR